MVKMKKAILKPCENFIKNGYDDECYCVGFYCGTLIMHNGNMYVLLTTSDD